MARTKAKPVADKTLKNEQGETVLIWKATMPLSENEHEQLSAKLRYEQEKSGVKIILVPYSVEVEPASAVDSAAGTDPSTSNNTDPVADPDANVTGSADPGTAATAGDSND